MTTDKSSPCCMLFDSWLPVALFTALFWCAAGLLSPRIVVADAGQGVKADGEEVARDDAHGAEADIPDELQEDRSDVVDAEGHVALIKFDGVITPISEQYFYRKLAKAQAAEAKVVIVEIDSPGGYASCSVNMADALNDVDWARTIAFVPREALSGAAIMSLGCREIVMSPTARMGDAGPIFQGEDALFRHAPEKIRSHLVRQVRDLAEAHGRPPALAEAMVDMDLVVYRVLDTKTGEVHYMSDPELDSLPAAEAWEKQNPVQESRAGLFLEVNGVRAVELGLADGLSPSRVALFDQLNVDGQAVSILETTWVDTTVMVLNWWPVTALLFLVGIVALYIELSAPGTGVGGLIAGLCFAIFFWSRFLGGTAGWLELVLFGAGVVFLAVELFVLPGFGIAGLSGLALMFCSLVMASQRFAPTDGLSVTHLLNSVAIILVTACVGVILMFVMTHNLGSMPFLSRLTLGPPAETQHHSTIATAFAGQGITVEVGEEGVADSPLRPAGRGRFGDDYHDVVSDGAYIPAGQPIRVTRIRENRIEVREIESD
ncbi:MAG: hypothetical protein KDA60_10175 [Planctomycetales bacterium]|nr:hypothetical protein [Planctomycetales bacterium]